jgi:hypothetical protein
LLEQEAKAAGIEDRVLVMEEGVTRFFLEATISWDKRVDQRDGCSRVNAPCTSIE